jgi:homoserine O-acetyltransferase
MKHIGVQIAATLAFTLTAALGLAAEYPVPNEGDWVARDFRFHTGEAMPELRLHYRTIGNSSGEPVLILHGTGGSGASMLTSAFAGELFGADQPLDTSRYFVILPDAIGTGKSSKPSDGLRMKFPKHDYDDMVEAQYRLVTEGLGIRHLRLVLGNSMGGMHTWLWGGRYPDAMDILVPMASQPAPMASRNWMLKADDDRGDPQRPGMEQWQLHQPAPFVAMGQRVLRYRDQWRNTRIPEAGADARKGRQVAR